VQDAIIKIKAEIDKESSTTFEKLKAKELAREKAEKKIQVPS
jgi:hypothetical protein